MENVDIRLEETEVYKVLEGRGDGERLSRVQKMYKHASDTLPDIRRFFSNYTLHDINHSIRVVIHMGNLVYDLNKLSNFELEVIIYAALFHDIGLVVFDHEIECIKKGNYIDPNGRDYKSILERSESEDHAIQEFIRPIHGYRSNRYICEYLEQELTNSDSTILSFVQELASICESHEKDIKWIEQLETHIENGNDSCNQQFIALILRLGDILDYDCQRTPYHLYFANKPKGKSDTEWMKHFPITNYQKVKTHQKRKYIYFEVNCKDQKIIPSVLEYLDYVDLELSNCIIFSRKFESRYNLNIDMKVERNIKPQEYTLSELSFSVDYTAMKKLLMGEKIYNTKKCGLREIIQNSIDACNTMKEIKKAKLDNRYYEYKPQIDIEIDKEKNKIIVKDNGTGMSEEIINNYFLNVGSSYYASNEYLDKNFNYKPIGNFGIGFLSAFMLSNDITVRTRYYNSNKLNTIRIYKNSKYICRQKEMDIEFSGTEIILEYSTFIEVFGNEKAIIEFIEKTFFINNITIRVHLVKNNVTFKINNKYQQSINKELFNISKNLIGINAYASIQSISYPAYTKKPSEANNDFTTFTYNLDKRELFLVEDTEENEALYESSSENTIVLVIYVNVTFYDFLASYVDNYHVDDYEYYGLDLFRKEFDIEEALIKEDIFYNEDEFIGVNIFINMSKNGMARINEILEDLINRFVNPHMIINDSELELDDVFEYPLSNSIGRSELKVIDYKDNIHRCLIYNKGILLDSAALRLNNVSALINIEDILINVNHPLIVPNVARDDISDDIKKQIGCAISKALHIYALNQLEYTDADKKVLENIINNCFNYNNEFFNLTSKI